MARRTRLAEGIYQDRYGLAAVVKVGRIQKEKRYPPETDLDVLQQWRSEERGRLFHDRVVDQRQRADPRRFARAVVTYLKTRKGRPGYKSDRSHLSAWLPFLGEKRRHLITAADVARGVTSWRVAQKAPRTIRHRLRVLRELYQALDGSDGPGASIELPVIPKSAPIPVAQATIIRVAKSLQQGKRHAKGYGDDPVKSRARFLVYATSGQRPTQIGRAQPADIDLERRLWFVRPAKGGEPIPLPLSDDMLKAWEVFIAAKAWGPFNTTSLAKLLRRHGWPKEIRPYMLRHTFAIDLLLNGADLGDVQGLLGHASIQTTRQFYAPILVSRLREAVAKRPSWLSTTVLPVVPPSTAPARGTPRSRRKRSPRRAAR